jgi:hypothetical protein
MPTHTVRTAHGVCGNPDTQARGEPRQRPLACDGTASCHHTPRARCSSCSWTRPGTAVGVAPTNHAPQPPHSTTPVPRVPGRTAHRPTPTSHSEAVIAPGPARPPQDPVVWADGPSWTEIRNLLTPVRSFVLPARQNHNPHLPYDDGPDMKDRLMMRLGNPR